MTLDPTQPDPGNGRFESHAILVKCAWALRSDPGHVRQNNEDFAGIHAPGTPDDSWDRGMLFAVADGMGGHAAGEVASRVAIDALLNHWKSESPSAVHQFLRTAARAANAAVFEASFEKGRRGMGTTLTALTFAGHEAVIAHIGDSRAYVVRGGQASQLTSDHSRVAEMLRTKVITAEQAANHPARSMLTRTLGAGPSVQVDIVKQPVANGDTFVLCSDGLWDLVSRAEIAQACAAIGTDVAPTPRDAADHLVDAALKRGAPDNVTVIVVRVTSPLPFPPASQRRSLFRRG